MIVYENLSNIFSYIGYGATFLIIWWLFHPDSFDKFVVYVRKILAYISKRHRKGYIAKYIEHDVAKALRKLEKYFKIDLRRIKIEWADVETAEAILEKEHILIRLRHHRNMKKNIAETLLAYTSYILPPTVKAVLTDETVLDTISFMISHSVAKDDPYLVHELRTALEAKYSKYDRDKLRDFYSLLSKIYEIYEQNLLIRLVIPEIIQVCTKVYPKIPADLSEELRKFIDYVHELVKGTLTEPVFKGKYFRTVIVRVAKPEKVLMLELEPHLNLIRNAIKRNLVNTVCIVAAGPYKPYWARKLTKKTIETLDLKVDEDETYEAKYKGEPNYIHCAILRRK